MAQPPHEPRPEPEPERPESASGDLDAKLAAEIEAALGDMSLEDMLDLADRPQPLRPRAGGPPRRDQRTGRILRIHGDDVFVEFGPKSLGVCPRSQFDNPPTVGERMEFLMTEEMPSNIPAFFRSQLTTVDVSQSDIRAFVRGELNVLKAQIARALRGNLDIATTYHLEDVVVRIDDILDPKN